MLQLDPPGQCHPDVHAKYLLSTQKLARKSQKRSKMAKSSQKGNIARQSSLLRRWFLRLFSCPSSRPVWARRFAPPNFDRGLKTKVASDDRRSIKKWSFTVRKVEKSAFLRAKIRPFEKKIWIFFFARLLGPSELVVLHPRTLIGD